MERLNVNMPRTYAGRSPHDIVEGLGWVRACPFYQVPASPASTRPERSEYAFACVIEDVFGDDMVTVRFDWEGTPGNRRQAFYPHEIHARNCACRACKTDHPIYLD